MRFVKVAVSAFLVVLVCSVASAHNMMDTMQKQQTVNGKRLQAEQDAILLEDQVAWCVMACDSMQGQDNPHWTTEQRAAWDAQLPVTTANAATDQNAWWALEEAVLEADDLYAQAVSEMQNGHYDDAWADFATAEATYDAIALLRTDSTAVKSSCMFLLSQLLLP